VKELWLARHGETEWSRARRHTGITDVPLTAEGLQQAEALGKRLRDVPFELVLTSPLLRARNTAEVAGFDDLETTDDLLEFDYGKYEGMTFDEITKERPGWNLWRDGCPGGETPVQVGNRVDRVIEQAVQISGRVLVVSHGHVSRILTARFVGLAADAGGKLAFDVGSLSMLGYEHDRPVIIFWNDRAMASH
jgi:broad specificity phosphatase PhoE